MTQHLLRDVRYAVRALAKRPGFASAVILALAVCIGANTAIFSLVDAVLLRGLPFRDPGRLVLVSEILSDVMSGPLPFSAPDYEELVRRNRSFSQIGIYRDQHYELSGIQEPDRIEGARISASLFTTLGIAPALGRNFTEQEDRDRHRVVILSAVLWHSKFASDRSILGKTMLLDRIPYTIVGVMPEHTTFPLRGPRFNDEPAQVFVPISFTKEELQGWGTMINDSVIARLGPGVTIERARAEVKTIANRIYNDLYPAVLRSTGFSLSADVVPLRDEVVGRVEPMLLVLFGAVGLLLLIGCADVASLLLTRATARRREMSIRTALGASRRELIAEVLIESGVLALAGGALGLLLAVWITTLLLQMATLNLPLAGRVHIDLRVLLFTLGLSLFTALVFGLFPAWQTSRAEVSEGLREGSRGQTTGRKHGRALNGLVAAQFAIALVLLVGAGLLFRSFSRLLQTNPGFRPDHILSMSVSLPSNAYQSGAQVRSFFERLDQSLATVPGVKAAALATSLPLSINEHRSFAIENPDPATLSIPHTVAQIWPLGDFFQAMGIPLKRGRYFDRRDTMNAPPVAIVNETLARLFFPHENPIGQRIKWGVQGSQSPWMTIVGVVGDVKQGRLNEPQEPETYTPYEQVPDTGDSSISTRLDDKVTDEFRMLKVVVRTANDPKFESTAIQKQIRSLDPSLPITEITTADEALRDSTRPERFNTILLGSFAAAALILAALGIAGVLAYSVAQRVSEIGVRLALGARKTDVLNLILLRGMRLAAIGTAIGLVSSLAITRVMSRLLFETSPFDAWILVAAPILLCLVGLISIWIPARRAAAVDPIQALRVE